MPYATTAIDHRQDFATLRQLQTSPNATTNPAPARKLRDRLILANTPLAQKFADRFHQKCREPYSELEGLAIVGLIKAVDRYDPEAKARFSTFAVQYINGEMLHGIRDHRHGLKITRRHSEIYSQIKRYQREEAKAGRSLTLATIAAKRGIDPDKWRSIQEEMELPTPTSIDALDDFDIADVEPDAPIAIPPHLDAAVGQLSANHRAAITMHYWAGLDAKAISKGMTLPIFVVEQLLSEAIAQLREAIDGEDYGGDGTGGDRSIGFGGSGRIRGGGRPD